MQLRAHWQSSHYMGQLLTAQHRNDWQIAHLMGYQLCVNVLYDIVGPQGASPQRTLISIKGAKILKISHEPWKLTGSIVTYTQWLYPHWHR